MILLHNEQKSLMGEQNITADHRSWRHGVNTTKVLVSPPSDRTSDIDCWRYMTPNQWSLFSRSIGKFTLKMTLRSVIYRVRVPNRTFTPILGKSFTAPNVSKSLSSLTSYSTWNVYCKTWKLSNWVDLIYVMIVYQQCLNQMLWSKVQIVRLQNDSVILTRGTQL